MDLNAIAITGRLAADPERYATGNGTAVTRLRVAITRVRRPAEERARADFVDVVVWGEQAEHAARYLAKGCRVGVRGRLEQRTWTTPEGAARSRLQVVADQVQFIDYKDRGPQPPAGPGGDAADAADTTDAPAEGSRPGATVEPVTDVVVWVDGGARGNPGPAGYGAVLTTPDGQVLAELAEGIGWATNNVAEYRGVIAGFERARSLGACRVRVHAGSQLVVRQLTGAWQVKTTALQPLWAEARRLAEGFEWVTFEHVNRDGNRRADALANQAMDAQGPITGPGDETPTAVPTNAAATEATTTSGSEPGGEAT